MKQKKKRITLFSLAVIILVIIAIAVVTFINAAYIKHSNDVVNTFKPADSIIPGIEEEFDGTLKEDVYFRVDDPENDLYTEYPVYVRAAIVITWQDADGIVYFSKPIQDTDYTIDLNTDDWELKSDGFYYYKDSVESGGETSILINECRQIKAAPADGYTLSVEIIVQTIQAVGSTDGENGTPVIDAWEDAGWNVSE